MWKFNRNYIYLRQKETVWWEKEHDLDVSFDWGLGQQRKAEKIGEVDQNTERPEVVLQAA